VNSGTAVADRPVTSSLASTDPAHGLINFASIEIERDLSSTLTPRLKPDVPENSTDVNPSAAPVISRLTKLVTPLGERPGTSSSTTEATTESGAVPARYLRVPQPRWTQEARQWMTGDFVKIHERTSQICIVEARRMHLAITELNVSVKRAWEEGSSELVMEVVVNGNLPQSLALWDAIGDEIQSWGRRQPPLRRRLLE